MKIFYFLIPLLVLTGIYSLFSGKLPRLLLDKNFAVTKKQGRVLGIMMLLIIPCIYLGAHIQKAYFENIDILYHFTSVLTVSYIIIIQLVIYIIREPIIQQDSSISGQIIQKHIVNSSLGTIASFFVFPTIFTATYSYLSSKKVLQIIEETKSGGIYKPAAELNMIISLILLSIYVSQTIILHS